MSDYKQILSDLYSRYNPQKVGEVDALLKKYPGRERELVLKIYMKYGGPTARKDAMRKFMELELESGHPSPTPAASNGVAPQGETSPEPRKRRWPWKRGTLLLLALVLISGLSYAGWYLAHNWPTTPSNQSSGALVDPPQTAPIYVLANAIIARPTCTEKAAGGETKMIHYGDRLDRYWRIGDCIQQRQDTMVDGQAVRALYYPDKYFANATTFHEIDGIFGNEEARQQIEHSYEKRALRAYFRTHGYTGVLDDEWRVKIAGEGKYPPVYQVFADETPASLNNWLRGYFFHRFGAVPETQRMDLATIIAPAKNSKSKKLLVFSFDEEGNVVDSHALDLRHYPRHKIRLFPEEGEDYARFFANNKELYLDSKNIVLEDPEGTAQDYLLLIDDKGIRLQNEVPRDTIRLPGMRPFIL